MYLPVGKALLYPENPEERYPRALNRIIDPWQTWEIEALLSSKS